MHRGKDASPIELPQGLFSTCAYKVSLINTTGHVISLHLKVIFLHECIP